MIPRPRLDAKRGPLARNLCRTRWVVKAIRRADRDPDRTAPGGRTPASSESRRRRGSGTGAEFGKCLSTHTRVITSDAFWPPKPKLLETAVSQRHFARGVGHVVEVAIGIGRGQVDGRGDDASMKRDGRRGRFDGAEAPIRWPIIDFWLLMGIDAAAMAEDALDGDGLHQVVQLGAGAVGVDVVDLRRVDAASRRAAVIDSAAPLPSGSGRVMPNASNDEP